jgi:cysteine desulfurase/selenocysteine lyase
MNYRTNNRSVQAPSLGGDLGEAIRSHFPALFQKVNGSPLVYFDNGATSHKPNVVIEAITQFYSQQNSNVHRGVHTLSQKATDLYEDARITVQKFINAKHSHEIIFTRGTTESINLVSSCVRNTPSLWEGDGGWAVISAMEHHSNIVPWQLLCEEKGAALKVIPITDEGEIIWEDYLKLLSSETKIVAITHVSNTLGTINPIKKMIHEAHKKNIPVLIDGAQAVPHMKVDVQDLDADFYCFSAHKMFGPTGIGVLYGKEKWLNAMPPYQGGGSMIKSVSFEKTTYNDLPYKFEAGTPHIEGVLGMAKAIDFINTVGIDNIHKYEHTLLTYATKHLLEIEGLRIIGTAKEKASVISFVIEGIHPLDIGTLLDQMGIAIRTGHHCTQPLMERCAVTGTCRVSMAFYNTFSEVDKLVEGLKRIKKMI